MNQEVVKVNFSLTKSTNERLQRLCALTYRKQGDLIELLVDREYEKLANKRVVAIQKDGTLYVDESLVSSPAIHISTQNGES